jgi:hypothetical protein
MYDPYFQVHKAFEDNFWVSRQHHVHKQLPSTSLATSSSTTQAQQSVRGALGTALAAAAQSGVACCLFGGNKQLTDFVALITARMLLFLQATKMNLQVGSAMTPI